MKLSRYRNFNASVILVLGASAATADDVILNNEKSVFDLSLEELGMIKISTGVRFEGHTLWDTPTSIAQISAEELRANHGGSNDLNMILREEIPSFSYLTEALNDGSSHVRAFSFRNLPPDETLVLINGKRLHRSALVQVSVGSPVALGSQGSDLSQIASYGLKKVEVLRDGASAQYGSDAIAGVINLILSDRKEGVEAQLQQGSTRVGDGDETRVSINAATALNESGFFNVTGEFVHKDEVSRGKQRPDAAYYITQGLDVDDPAQIWGSPILDSRRLLWNARLDLSRSTQAYMFGNFSDARSDASFNYRALTRGFFNFNLDTNNQSAIACAPVTGDQFGYQTAQSCLAQANANPALFNFQRWFPNGFTPRLVANNQDFSEVIGIKGDLLEGNNFDISFSYARNRIEFQLDRTINPSLGADSPTSFALGTLAQKEKNLNADFIWPLNAQWSLATGVEWRQESYEPEAGETASWQAGPYASLGIGSNGMPGIDPAAEGQFNRRNVSVYGDSEYHLSEAFLISVAARFERYSDFGGTSTGKFSMRYLLNENLSVRGAFGTGFRAPSPAQSNFTNIGHNASLSGANVLVSGIIPPSNPIAQFFGARPLQPETSHNYSFGIAFQQQPIAVTVDTFRIEVKDRIELSNGISLTDEIRNQMRAAGINNSDEYDTISVFANAVDSTTQGIDVSASYAMNTRAGITDFTLDVSHVNTHAQSNGQGFVPTEQTLFNLGNQMALNRANLTVSQRLADWKINAAAIYYGPFSIHDGVTVTRYSSKSLINIETIYSAWKNDGWLVAAGIGNLFDTQAHRQDLSAIGAYFINENPFEYQGRSYYANATYSF